MKNKPHTYRDLIFWQKSFESTKLLIKLIKKLPSSVENRIIINQVLRSAMSIGANIAEGYGRQGKKEFSRFLQVSLGSANETEYWIFLLKESNPNFDNEIDYIFNKNQEVIKMLASSLKTIRLRNK